MTPPTTSAASAPASIAATRSSHSHNRLFGSSAPASAVTSRLASSGDFDGADADRLLDDVPGSAPADDRIADASASAAASDRRLPSAGVPAAGVPSLVTRASSRPGPPF